MASRAVSRHYEACLAPTNTTATQFSILCFLQQVGPTPLRPLADALELERTSLYRALRPLQRKRLVEVQSDPDDGRVKQARITRTGQTKISEVLPYWRQAQASFLAAVGPTSWSTVSDNLEQLRERMATDPFLHGQIR